MDDDSVGVEGFDEFVDSLAGHLGLDAGRWQGSDRLVEVVHWDSLAVAEVQEWLAGRCVEVPVELVAELDTLEDLHHYATSPATRTTRPSPTPAFTLTTVGPDDEHDLFRLLTDQDLIARFRLRGITPSPENFHAQLWERVLAQFSVRPSPNNRIAGLVTAYDADLRNGHVHIAVAGEASIRRTGILPAATAQLIDYLFETFPLRKIYAEALASDADQFRSGADRLFAIEGRLTDHAYVHGSYEDLLIMATTKEMWQAKRRSAKPT